MTEIVLCERRFLTLLKHYRGHPDLSQAVFVDWKDRKMLLLFKMGQEIVEVLNFQAPKQPITLNVQTL